MEKEDHSQQYDHSQQVCMGPEEDGQMSSMAPPNFSPWASTAEQSPIQTDPKKNPPAFQPTANPSSSTPKAANKGSFWTSALNVVQGGLDIAGLVPGFGEVADLANAGIYTARGDYLNAGLSAAAAIPFLGWGATGAKGLNKGLKMAGKGAGELNAAGKVVKNGTKAADATKDAAKAAGKNTDNSVTKMAKNKGKKKKGKGDDAQGTTKQEQKGGGKNSQHSNARKREKARQDYEQAKKELEDLQKKPNKTPDDKKAIEKLKNKVKDLKRKMDDTGENHSRKPKGNR